MNKALKTNSIQAWILAARPKTLTGAAVPVMLGCALAWSDGHRPTTSQAANTTSVADITDTIGTAGITSMADAAGVADTVNAAGITCMADMTDTIGTAGITSMADATGAADIATYYAETAAESTLLTSFLLPALLCLLFAFLMQINANFINDLWDYLKGSDREDRLGPERACSQGWITPQAMKHGIAVTTATAALTGCGLLFYGGWELIAVGAACMLFAFLYTAGPYPLAYHGWGDVLVLLFFGLIPVGCTYYVLRGEVSSDVFIVAVACGLAVDTLLMVNNYRDREQDARSGKHTLVVRLGAKAGEWLYLLPGIAATALCLLLANSGRTAAALLPLLYLIPHIATWRQMVRIGRGRELNDILGKTSRNILLFGILLALGLL